MKPIIKTSKERCILKIWKSQHFNLILQILDEPIELSDLFSRSMKTENERLRLDAPEVTMPGSLTNNLMITQAPIRFSFPKVIVG